MNQRTDLPPEFRGRAFRVGDARAAGVARDRLDARDLIAPARGARVPAGGSFLAAVSAVLAPDQAFSGPTAAKLWGMPLPLAVERDERLWVTTFSHDRAMNRPGVVASRRRYGHIVRVAGHAVLDPVQTWCSLASVLPVHDLVAVADRIITTSRSAKALARPEDLTSALSSVRYGRPVLARAAVEMRMGAWSRPESLVRVACLRAGLPEPQLNTAVPVGDGRWAAPDLAWHDYMVCAEYDGHWHDDPRQRAEDLERHELLVDAGWIVTHIRAGDVFPEPLVAVARILRRLGSRGYRHPGPVRRGPEGSWLA